MAETKAKKTTKKTEEKPTKQADLATLKLQLRNLMLDIRTGKEKNTSKARSLRKEIARLITTERKEITK